MLARVTFLITLIKYSCQDTDPAISFYTFSQPINLVTAETQLTAHYVESLQIDIVTLTAHGNNFTKCLAALPTTYRWLVTHKNNIMVIEALKLIPLLAAQWTSLLALLTTLSTISTPVPLSSPISQTCTVNHQLFNPDIIIQTLMSCDLANAFLEDRAVTEQAPAIEVIKSYRALLLRYLRPAFRDLRLFLRTADTTASVKHDLLHGHLPPSTATRLLRSLQNCGASAQATSRITSYHCQPTVKSITCSITISQFTSFLPILRIIPIPYDKFVLDISQNMVYNPAFPTFAQTEHNNCTNPFPNILHCQIPPKFLPNHCLTASHLGDVATAIKYCHFVAPPKFSKYIRVQTGYLISPQITAQSYLNNILITNLPAIFSLIPADNLLMKFTGHTITLKGTYSTSATAYTSFTPAQLQSLTEALPWIQSLGLPDRWWAMIISAIMSFAITSLLLSAACIWVYKCRTNSTPTPPSPRRTRPRRPHRRRQKQIKFDDQTSFL